MKTYDLLLIPVIIMAILVSCHGRRHTTTIAVSSSNNYQWVEYSGRIIFSGDKTGIQGMEPGGYLKFDDNGEKLIAESDSKGLITYKLSNGDKVKSLTSNSKTELVSAIKLIADQTATKR
jgi:hypothetical protein